MEGSESFDSQDIIWAEAGEKCRTIEEQDGGGEGKKEVGLSIERHCHIAKTKRERRGDAEVPTCNNTGVLKVDRRGMYRAQVGG